MRQIKKLTVGSSRQRPASQRGERGSPGAVQLTVERGFSGLMLIIIVAVIGVVAFFAFGILNIGKQGIPVPQIPDVIEDQQVKNLQKQSSSDELPFIEKDLESTNLEDLDQGIDEVSKSLGDL
ncbi:hypothetical protein A2697_00245 [Candidatus Curtissbacteria bacterium RIFCSPHIGHO2_01_FULL_41_44]|uniref:Uncharacterized protein n=1 Tax=Candidatus Curtissbacteria bacterium RIFCSPLOWO2_01_FULL_42_50 TaxID=1797730 RepID=A0A1F5H2C1_9BACT|nr:MAG: hypothetical protein A2697_00245 [Candidatus Curtissbacteria bacterium RIFCSPHIGHO2_01_FULL_41_44]OGD92640.1 MAG: hypothetical protein A3C33_03455 [Candidatus Curtissbacteria bacterium RIFCSPHIGHO2_02_FULL_42_58]OGD96384.1 MAG: hypothetical protein A3E71_05040 [Candidatus Curtissbacteria bacterium RIFCSPHIGHO2_12_FULL_42_33]OGD98195.1 MAG: hypothetical protein A3B54_02260 [Candidatus Curtissbacteria bacterium RIFCSPLOWO2_01_FULL_42_50]OGE02792.1 MAG: hypothetical protein A3G16_03215 [Ca